MTSSQNRDHMSFEEGAALFRLVLGKVDLPSVAEANEVIYRVRKHTYSERTLRPLIALTRDFIARETEGHPLVLKDEEAHELAQRRKGYTVSATWVRDRAFWFQQWRARQRSEIQQRRQRLERVLQQMWIPETESVPGDLFEGDQDFRRRKLGDSIFRWQQGPPPYPIKVIRCWMDQTDEDWLRSEIINRLPPTVAGAFRENYRKLQERACRFVEKAHRYESDLDAGLPPQVLLQDVRAARIGGGLMGSAEAIARAEYLDREPVRLTEEIEAFKDDLRRAIEESGNSVIGGTS